MKIRITPSKAFGEITPPPSKSYADLCSLIEKHANEHGYAVEIFQSNHEGEVIDCIQKAYFDGTCGIIINPAAYTHTSVAILDALKATGIPTVEVHISDVSSRESYRQISYVREYCEKTVSGQGINGYIQAIKHLTEAIKD